MGRYKKHKGRQSITFNFSYKREVICDKCNTAIPNEILHISVNTNEGNFGAYGFRSSKIHLCRDCWDKLYIETCEKYDSLKDDYEKYLKLRIVKSLNNKKKI